jgi:threonine dehydratase
MIMIFPTIADVLKAGDRIGSAIERTPCLESRTLSRMCGCDLFLKFENLHFTASFKERGALNKLLTLSNDERAAGVCAMSAGNHAQGVAYHASRLGIPATIVMPRGTPLTKIARTRDHGAEVVIEGANLTAALDVARAIEARRGLAFVHPYDDLAVIAGQGTMTVEILEQVADLDVLVVPIGGGGLISGALIAARTLKPNLKIYGVQSRTYPSMIRALEGDDSPCDDGLTISEGIAVKTAGKLTREIVRSLVDDVLLVEESAIEQAVALLLLVEKTVVEGAGAVGLAAILEHPERFAGLRVATPLTGGNIDLRVLASVAMRELVRNDQLFRFEVPISDQPGQMAHLAAILAEGGANIVDVGHDRLSLSLNPKGAILEVLIEVQDATHGGAVLAALAESGFHALPKAVHG